MDSIGASSCCPSADCPCPSPEASSSEAVGAWGTTIGTTRTCDPDEDDDDCPAGGSAGSAAGFAARLAGAAGGLAALALLGAAVFAVLLPPRKVPDGVAERAAVLLDDKPRARVHRAVVELHD